MMHGSMNIKQIKRVIKKHKTVIRVRHTAKHIKANNNDRMRQQHDIEPTATWSDIFCKLNYHQAA